MYRRIQSDLCNVPRFLLPGVRLQIKFTKAKLSFYLMNTKADPTNVSKFLDDKLYVRRVRAHPSILLAHNDTMKTNLAYYDMTSVALKIFTFSSVSSSLSIDHAVTGHLPERLLFATVDNDSLGTVNSNPYKF
jgi:hypothetical protein